jgi:DNA-binding transcriptional ArsR family regulator
MPVDHTQSIEPAVSMSGHIPRLGDRTETPPADVQPHVVNVGGDDATEVFDALGSGTARCLLDALHQEPATPSELADRLDTSVQNVHYHLDNLQSAGLVTALDTRYSEKGKEMTVYGPTRDPIVLVGSDDRRRALEGSFAEAAGGIAALALASLAVQVVVERFVGGLPLPSDVIAPASPGGSGPVVDGATRVLVVALEAVEPGLLFFIGGALTLLYAARRTRTQAV